MTHGDRGGGEKVSPSDPAAEFKGPPRPLGRSLGAEMDIDDLGEAGDDRLSDGEKLLPRVVAKVLGQIFFVGMDAELRVVLADPVPVQVRIGTQHGTSCSVAADRRLAGRQDTIMQVNTKER